MRSIPSDAFLLLIVCLGFIEVLCFFNVIQLAKSKTVKNWIALIYWIVTAVVFFFLFAAYLDSAAIRHVTNYNFYRFVIFLALINVIPKLIAAFFMLLSLPLRLFRYRILARMVLLGGLIIGFGVMIAIAYGSEPGRKMIRVERVTLNMDSLPEGLEGLKIVHISDFHLGGFKNTRLLERITTVVNSESPDLILFTGDMVNNFHHEMDGKMAPLQQLNALYGKFAVLGNHDYGDYSEWDSEDAKIHNSKLIRQKIKDAGFTLLLNEAVRVPVNDTSLFIIGVENWSHPPNPCYADLEAAMNDAPRPAFCLLMTHVPDHWLAQVLYETDIPLTFAGHSHGGQFAFKIAGIEFSPVRFKSAYWGGLYGKDNRFLYVNRGTGTIGPSVRIDMNPEVTVVTLSRFGKLK